MQEILRLDEEKLDRHRDLMRRNLGPKWHVRDGDAIKTSSFGRLEITMANGSWSGSPHASLLAARQPTAGVELSFSSSDQMEIQMQKMLIKHHIWVKLPYFELGYLIRGYLSDDPNDNLWVKLPYFQTKPILQSSERIQSGFANCLFTRHWEVWRTLLPLVSIPKIQERESWWVAVLC